MAKLANANGTKSMSVKQGKSCVPSKGFMCLVGSPGFGSPWVPLSTVSASAYASLYLQNPLQSFLQCSFYPAHRRPPSNGFDFPLV